MSLEDLQREAATKRTTEALLLSLMDKVNEIIEVLHQWQETLSK
jgi:hypothetical protein